VSVVSGVGDVRSRSARFGLVATILGFAMLAVAPAASAAAAITLTTPFPAIAVAPGSSPSFDVSITTASAGRVGLTVGAVPTGWRAVVVVRGAVVLDGTSTADFEPPHPTISSASARVTTVERSTPGTRSGPVSS
jgi:hypothetical protein